MVYMKGNRGRSKAEVKISVSTVFATVAIHVWEGGNITHSFYPDEKFCQAMIDNGQSYLDNQQRLQERSYRS